MSGSENSKLSSSDECLQRLKEVMICLDHILPESSPRHAMKIGLAAAHLQLVIDILEDPSEDPEPSQP